MASEIKLIINTDPKLAFQRPELIALRDYWNSRRNGRLFPSRSDINPREMTSLLPWVHMYNVVPGSDDYHKRLIGSALSDLFYRLDGDGPSISSLPSKVFERLKQSLDWVVRERAPLRTYNPSSSIPGQDFQGSESFFAPLSSDGTSIDVIIALTMLNERK